VLPTWRILSFRVEKLYEVLFTSKLITLNLQATSCQLLWNFEVTAMLVLRGLGLQLDLRQIYIEILQAISCLLLSLRFLSLIAGHRLPALKCRADGRAGPHNLGLKLLFINFVILFSRPSAVYCYY